MRKPRNDVSVVELVTPCPHCGTDMLTPAGRGRALCLGCRRCWGLEGDVVRWVSPARCLGCALRPLCVNPVQDDDRITVLSVSARHQGRTSRNHRFRAPITVEMPHPLPPPA